MNNLCLFCQVLSSWKSFPGGSDGKESACNAGDRGSIRGSGRSPGEGNVRQPNSSILAWGIPENPGILDRETWRGTVEGIAASVTTTVVVICLRTTRGAAALRLSRLRGQGGGSSSSRGHRHLRTQASHAHRVWLLPVVLEADRSSRYPGPYLLRHSLQ